MAEAPQQSPKNIQFTVELGDDKNRSFMVPVFGKRRLRGAWKLSNIKGPQPDENFADMPDLPGLRISVDYAAKTISLTDPLGSDNREAKALLTKAQRICRATLGLRYGPEKNARLKNATQDALKNACYWVRRLLDASCCTLVSGEVPAMEAVDKLPGKVQFESYDHKSGKRQQRESVQYVSLKDALASETEGEGAEEFEEADA